MLCLHKKFSIDWIFQRTLEAIGSPLRQHPKYFTVLSYFREWTLYEILRFGGLFFLAKIIVFVLLQPKWIDNLLSQNHSEWRNFCLWLFIIFWHSYLDRRYKYRHHSGLIQLRLMTVVSEFYKLGIRVALK